MKGYRLAAPVEHRHIRSFLRRPRQYLFNFQECAAEQIFFPVNIIPVLVEGEPGRLKNDQGGVKAR